VAEKDIKISWYGERGVVNAVVAGIMKAGVPGAIAFLEAVTWAKRPNWLGHIKSVELIVEVGCGEFGDPDLIIVYTTKNNQCFAILVEAKVISYQTSAGTNQSGIRVKGYNSTINGQLSLKYRLALALSQADENDNELSESNAVYNAYKRPWTKKGLGDTISWPRHLKKPSVLSLLHDAGLVGLPFEHFYFVAWTWDRNPFFESPDFHDSVQRPLFLDQDGNEQWEKMFPQLGWIGFNQIAEAEQLTDHLGDEFCRALRTMRESHEPPLVVEGDCNGDLRRVSPYNIQEKSQSDTIRELRIIEKLAAEYFKDASIEQKVGSSSIKYAGKVIVKIVPQGHTHAEYLLLGVSTSLGRDHWGGYAMEDPILIGSGKTAQPFYTLCLPSTEEARKIASDIIQDIAEFYGSRKDPQ